MSNAIRDLVTALNGITADETDPVLIIERVKPIAVNLAEETSWVRPEFYEVDERQGMGINILNQEDNDSNLVEVISWLPGLGIAPHDHQTWGVVVGIDGTEMNNEWRRLDDGSEQMNSERENWIKNTAAKWEMEKCEALNTIAVECLAGPGAAVWSRAPGLPETAFQHDNMITKREVRAATLAALSPLPGETLWDIGAGSGAIAIEWLRLVPSARAIAVESNEDRVQSIRTNALNLGVPSLEIVNGHAPRVFVGINGSPDAIFVGGGVSNDALMHACWDQLATGGRLIANAVTLQAQQSLLNFHEKWGGETTKLSIARENRVGRFSGLRPLMEVWQLRVVKK